MQTVPAATQAVFDEIEEMKRLYVAIDRADQLELDAIFAEIKQHTDAFGHAASLYPFDTTVLLALLEQRKYVKKLYQDVIEKLQRIALKLQSPQEDVVDGEIIDEDLPGLAD